jgi:hypothetical protein
MKLKNYSLRLRLALSAVLCLFLSFSEMKAQSIDPILSTRRSLPANWLGWDLATTVKGRRFLYQPVPEGEITFASPANTSLSGRRFCQLVRLENRLVQGHRITAG